MAAVAGNDGYSLFNRGCCHAREPLRSGSSAPRCHLVQPFSLRVFSLLMFSLFSFAANRMSPATGPPRGPA